MQLKSVIQTKRDFKLKIDIWNTHTHVNKNIDVFFLTMKYKLKNYQIKKMHATYTNIQIKRTKFLRQPFLLKSYEK